MSFLGIGKSGQKNIQFSDLKAGLREADKKNASEKEKSIFKTLDKDGNGVLDAKELETLQEYDANGDGIASKKDAKKFIKENDLKGIKKKDVLQFLQNNNIKTDDVENVQNTVDENGKEQVLVKYKDGKVVTINSDKSSSTTQTDADGNIVTENKDALENLTKKTTAFKDGSESQITYDTKLDANGKPIPKEEIFISADKDTKTTTIYNEGEKAETTIDKTSDGSKTIIKYDKYGNPATATTTQGLNVSEYEYVKGKQRLTSKVENKGLDNQRNTVFTYDDEAGTVTSIATELGGTKKTTTVKKGDTLLSKTIIEGDKTTSIKKNNEGDGYTEVIKDGNKSTTTNQLNSNMRRIASKKVVNGKEYNLTYDGNGNTTGIIVQNGESPAAIAKKFGCTEQELRELNKDVLKGKKYFDVGSEIKIPRELEADNKALQGRKSAAEAKAEYARDEQIRAQKRAQAAARDKAYREQLGLTDYKGAGDKVQGDYYENGKKTRSVTFTKIGNATHGRTICKDKSGKIYVVAHNGVILKETWVKVSAHREVQAVGKRRVAVEKGVRDGHGRKTVYDGDGKTFAMSQDKKILKNSYVAKSDKSDLIRKDSKTAQQSTVEMLEAQLNSAKAAFNEQMKRDGWAGDVADGASKIWHDLFGGTGNNASQVREEFKTYQKNLNDLKMAAKQGDSAFKAKFKQIFDIEYNPKAIADYNMNPTEANYEKAFDKKDNIAQRVAKYNSSQQTWSTVVKTGAELGITTGVTVAADALDIVTFGLSTPLSAAAIGATTFVADVLVEGTDKYKFTGEYKDADGNIVKDDGNFRDGTNWGEIAKEAGTDAAIAASTFGIGKYATSAYKIGKASVAASKVERAAEKVATSAAKAETGLVKTTEKVAEKAVEKTTEKVAEKAATKAANTTVSKAEQAAIETASDVGVSAAADYAQNGEVTLEGVALNAAVGSAGFAAERLAGKIRGMKKGSHASETHPSTKTRGEKETDFTNKFENNNSAHKTEGAASSKEAGGSNSTSKANDATSSNNVNNEASSKKTGEQSHPMSDAEIADKINEIKPKLSEAKVADEIKKEFADIFNGSITDPAEIKKRAKKLYLKAHPDLGGSNDLASGIQLIKDAESPAELKKAIADFNKLIDEKSANLSKLQKEMDSLNAAKKAGNTANADNTANTAETSKTTNTAETSKSESKTEPKTEQKTKNKHFENLSDEILNTFSERIQARLSTLKNGQSIGLIKGTKHYTVKNNNGKIEITTILDENELVRTKGNGGKEVNPNYVKTSVEAREYLQDAIASGRYTDSYESYVQTMNNMHKISYSGRSGKNEWYSQTGSGHHEINPGQIRGKGAMANNRVNTAIEAEEIAKKYGDNYRVGATSSQVNLKGIPDKYKPTDYNFGKHTHKYPDGEGLNYYYKEMHRTSKEALDLIKNGASEQQILKKIAEHYQYAANARPYGQINNSLFMNETNTLLQMAGLKTIPHGNLDQISMHLQPETFQRYFIDQYYQTAL